jgi:hypothetical protein
MAVKRWRTRALARTEWRLSWGKPRPNLKGCTAKEEEDVEEEQEQGINCLIYTGRVFFVSSLRNLIISI